MKQWSNIEVAAVRRRGLCRGHAALFLTQPDYPKFPKISILRGFARGLLILTAFASQEALVRTDTSQTARGKARARMGRPVAVQCGLVKKPSVIHPRSFCN